MKFLRPIKDKHVYTRKVFKAIFAAWFAAFWQHLMQAIELVDEYYNSKDVLIEAIMSHRIQYVDGKFTGSFNAAISKELLDIGAKYDKRSKAFIIARNKLPIDINHAIAVASLATATMYKKVLDFLNSFNPSSIMPLVNGQIDAELDEILEDLDDQAKRTVEDAITVQVHLSPTEKQQLKQMYTDNLQLPIKNFAQDQVVRIRQLVEQNLFHGLGDKALVDVLVREFNVTRNKAMFWARQETGLLVSAYRQAAYKTVGITKYKWSTSHDERVRVMHKDLDGKIFEFANPPVTNEKGDRNNPGEDWQCRCQAIPVFENSEYHNGGKGSGNHYHVGRVGLVGGSVNRCNISYYSLKDEKDIKWIKDSIKKIPSDLHKYIAKAKIVVERGEGDSLRHAACCIGTKIVLMDNYKFAEELAKQYEKDGDHPKGAGDAESIIIHEIGHAWYNATTNSEIESILQGYFGNDYKEVFAEAFVDVVYNRKGAHENSKKMIALLMKDDV